MFNIRIRSIEKIHLKIDLQKLKNYCVLLIKSKCYHRLWFFFTIMLNKLDSTVFLSLKNSKNKLGFFKRGFAGNKEMSYFVIKYN